MFHPAAVTQGTVLTDLPSDDRDYQSVADQMQTTIQEHKDNAGGVYDRCNIIKVRARDEIPTLDQCCIHVLVSVRGRSQFMKAYREYTRGKSTFYLLSLKMN